MHCTNLLTTADNCMFHILGLVSKGKPRVTWLTLKALFRSVCLLCYRKQQQHGTD